MDTGWENWLNAKTESAAARAVGALAPLDLIKGHLTEQPYQPVDRGFPENPQGWFKPASGHDPHKEYHYVAKIQRFESGGYEATITRQDLAAIAALTDAPRAGGKREQGEQNENDVISSIMRSKRRVRHLIKSMGCDRLLTLTRRENDPDSFWSTDDWKKAWDRFNRGCKRMGVTLAYVAVLEKHKKGNYHLHAAIVGHISVKHIRKLWYICLGGTGQEKGGRTPGNVDIKMRQDLSVHQRRAGLAKYVSKYITKQADQTEFNKKRYWPSKHKLPDTLRYILTADDALSSLAEIAGIWSLDVAELFKQAFHFPNGLGFWFSYDDSIAADVPF